MSNVARSLCIASAELRTKKVNIISKYNVVSNQWAFPYQPMNFALAPLVLLFQSRKPFQERQTNIQCVADANKTAAGAVSAESENIDTLLSENSSEAETMPSTSANGVDQAGVGFGAESVNADGSQISSKADAATVPTVALPQRKRTPLTAREKLRAARVLSRYMEEPRPSTRELGSNVLDALKASDGGKTRGLPKAPTNMLDDGKRGLPKEGLTFDFPGGVDLFIILFSFVFISTLMFATTYLVWKVGAIHFNEY